MFVSGQTLQTFPLLYEQNDGHIKNTSDDTFEVFQPLWHWNDSPLMSGCW